MRRAATGEEQARQRLVSLLASPEPVAASLRDWCDRDSVERVGRRLRKRLRRGSVVAALEAVSRELPPGDEGLVVAFWARAEARSAGVPVPFDALGLERLASKA